MLEGKRARIAGERTAYSSQRAEVSGVAWPKGMKNHSSFLFSLFEAKRRIVSVEWSADVIVFPKIPV